MNDIVVCTTFANHHFEQYAKKMIQTFTANWPAEVPLLIQLDNDVIQNEVKALLRPQDAIAVGWNKDHAAFVERNKGKDDPTNYRKQAVRFAHKIFAIKRVRDSITQAEDKKPRYLIWMDADVHTAGKVTMADLQVCLPKEGDAVSYLGRKDWPHSECGWMGFDLKNGGDEFIDVLHGMYASDAIFNLDEWHDSWIFDHVRKSKDSPPCTNLTEGKPGMEIWQHSPMARWSIHYKGPAAKAALEGKPMRSGNIQIQTKNAIPDEQLHEHIRENQRLIKNWIHECELNDEEIVVVSAGPTLIAEDVRREKGKKIIAVKHALQPLKEAGVKPWGCILLDPRPHMMNFVQEPDTDIIWFVASQVNPNVTCRLLAAGCKVWGYHASVGANEGFLTEKQPSAVVHGGSATATRGLFVLRHLGFHNLTLYGYDLSFPDKPDLTAVDDKGQPKFLEISTRIVYPFFQAKKCFWTEPQLLAQYEEIQHIINSGAFAFKAHGSGVVPLLIKGYEVSSLRQKELRAKIKPFSHYERLLWNKTRRTRFLTRLRRKSR